MIQLSKLFDSGLRDAIYLLKRKQKLTEEELENTIYIMKGNSSRPADVYVSPNLEDADRLAQLITQRFKDIEVRVEGIGSPATRRWLGLKSRLVERRKEDSAKICIFAEYFINGRIPR